MLPNQTETNIFSYGDLSHGEVSHGEKSADEYFGLKLTTGNGTWTYIVPSKETIYSTKHMFILQ